MLYLALFVEYFLEIGNKGKPFASLRNCWAMRPLTLPLGLLEVIYIQFLTSLRKYWAILDLNQGPKDYESVKILTRLLFTK